MRKNLILILYISILSCNQSGTNKSGINSEIDSLQKDTLRNERKLSKREEEITDSSLLLNTSAEILEAIRQRDYNKLASFVHPKYGVRFSPYAYIDTTSAIKLTSAKLIQLAKQHKLIDWHSSLEDTAQLMNIDNYFKKFVYDVDFLNAPIKSINEFHTQGTDLNNIVSVYSGSDVVEFFFPGFDKKYDGMDFRGLRLVFKSYNNKPFLIAIVHDEWTP